MSPHFSANTQALSVEHDATDLAIGQMIALAKVANVSFHFANGRLAVRFANPVWKLWSGVRQCLDEIGMEALVAYFGRTTPEEREQLSAAA